MDVALGRVILPTEDGCTVELLDGGERVEATYSEPIRRYGIQILCDDVVALDCGADPPAVVFRWALDRVARIEGDQVFAQQGRDGQPLTLAEGLAEHLVPGDGVYVAFGQIYGTCSPSLPAQPERLRAAWPAIEAMLRRMGGGARAKTVCGQRAAPGPGEVTYLTAETAEGRAAIDEVMAHSYAAEVVEGWPAWTRVRLVDGIPVSYVVVDPDKRLDFPGGEVRYAFVNDVATREDRRREGHFRALMEHVFASLREAGISLLLLHGRYPLYRPFGFEVFTHHSGVFVSPAQIERTLGFGDADAAGDAQRLLAIEDYRGIADGLLVVSGVEASVRQAWQPALHALRAAAAVARARGKDRILFEHPACDARYSTHASLETHLTTLARTCGAQVVVQGADPEGGSIPDADWIKVLDAAAFVRQVLDVLDVSGALLPDGEVCLDTDAGAVTIACREGRVTAHEGKRPGVETAAWPSGALAQLVTGYRSAETLCMLHQTPLPPRTLALLDALFPRRWRLSRNESWVYRS